MQLLGADITKAAVMPRTERDVLELLEATLAMKEQYEAPSLYHYVHGGSGERQQALRGAYRVSPDLCHGGTGIGTGADGS